MPVDCQPSLLDSSPAKLESWLAAQGAPPFRARQVRKWLFERRATTFSEMTDLPAPLRGQLERAWRMWTTQIASHLTTPDGTEKLLLELADGNRIECVLLRDQARRTICISTQVGCAMGCVFCASGLDGVVRNLTTGEILEQMLRLERLLPNKERLSHVVVMGMGEPLANLDRLLPALDTAHRSDGLGISARRITISTVGLPEAIVRLADRGLPYHLAISLHAPNDALRNQLVPVNRRIGLAKILSAADTFFERTGRRLTYEYVLLAEINDRPHQARLLAELLAGRPALLNVIPYNPVAGLGYATPSDSAVARFVAPLVERGINVQVRERKGDRIHAACGQLRRSVGTSSDPALVQLPGSSSDLAETIRPSESA